MKFTSKILPIVILLQACSDSGKDTTIHEESSVIATTQENTEPEDPRDPVWHRNDDTLFSYCRSGILNAYLRENKLTLSAGEAYRDQVVTIIGIEEVQEDVQRIQSNSSCVFLAQGDSLIPVRLIPENLSEKNPFQYPNRINGTLLEVIDINQNGRPDYLMEYTRISGDEYHRESYFIELDTALRVVYPLDIRCETNGFIGQCEDFFGMSQWIEIVIQENGKPPILVIHTETSRCDEHGKKAVVDTYRVNFQWNSEEKVFRQV